MNPIPEDQFHDNGGAAPPGNRSCTTESDVIWKPPPRSVHENELTP